MERPALNTFFKLTIKEIGRDGQAVTIHMPDDFLTGATFVNDPMLGENAAQSEGAVLDGWHTFLKGEGPQLTLIVPKGGLTLAVHHMQELLLHHLGTAIEGRESETLEALAFQPNLTLPKDD